jgi:hypothetical protein
MHWWYKMMEGPRWMGEMDGGDEGEGNLRVSIIRSVDTYYQ